MPCKREQRNTWCSRKLQRAVTNPTKSKRQKHVCIVEAHESTRKRLEPTPPKDHENHNAEKGFTSLSHYNLVHKFLPMLQAMKSPDAKAAVDKELKKLETMPAWQLNKMKSKSEVFREAQRERNKVHFATMTDICHLKNAELEPNFQKYKATPGQCT